MLKMVKCQMMTVSIYFQKYTTRQKRTGKKNWYERAQELAGA